MSQEKEHLQAIQDIKTMMERSTKFSSISGKAGIVVGMLAVIVFAGIKWYDVTSVSSLFVVMVGTLMVALFIGLYLSIAKANKEGAAIFDTTAKRFLVQFFIPLFVGGMLCLIFACQNQIEYIPAMMLIFYGFALVHASKFSLDTIKNLGYLEIIAGLVATAFTQYGMWCWVIGFGVLHIIYGFIIYTKYEK
jgi:hypothetical protein